MNRTEKIITQIELLGVEFDKGYKPTRAHHREQGGERMTLLCCEVLGGRGKYQLDSNLPCTYHGQRFNRVELCETLEPLPDGIRITPDWPGDLQIWFNR